MKITHRMRGWLVVLLLLFGAWLLMFVSPHSENGMEGAIGGCGFIFVAVLAGGLFVWDFITWLLRRIKSK